MTGLARNQVDDLVQQIHDRGVWSIRRRRALDPHRSVVVVLLYLRHNLSQDLLAELFCCSQPTVSRLVSLLIPILTDLLAPLADSPTPHTPAPVYKSPTANRPGRP